MRIKWKKLLLLALIVIVVIVGVLFIIPATRASILWHLADVSSRISMWINPPAQVEFNPATTSSIDLQATLTAMAPTQNPGATITASESTPVPTGTATPVPTPLPASASIPGGKYFTQHGFFNYCAPANLAMELSYWGWNGKMEDVGASIKPYEKDKNVMPYEMVDYVKSVGLSAVDRVGGDAETLKRFISAGYPVLIERGVFFRDLTGVISWMGHYGVVTGYDDAKQEFIVQDSYIEANHVMTYDEVMSEWRSFNYAYIIVYSADRESQVMQLLGADADAATNFHNTWVKASNEVSAFTGTDEFFTWYNVGTNLVGLQDYGGAAAAYDHAFALYNALPEDLSIRPYRILWYQTGPYFAYYCMGRYQDVIDLATNNSIGMVRDNVPALEESFYWRGMAENALEQTDKAIEDFRTALSFHAGFAPAENALQQMGVTP
jgi:hypothetical protein